MAQLYWGPALQKVTNNGVHSKRAGLACLSNRGSAGGGYDGGWDESAVYWRSSRAPAVSLSDFPRA